MNLQVNLKKQIMKNPLQTARLATQLAFTIFLLYVGYQFYRFYLHFATSGMTPYVEKPPAVEGFLPISSLLSLRFWFSTGHFDMIHPAGLVLFTFFVASGIIFRRTFCSWLCPVGTLSEWIGNLGKKIFKRDFNPPRWVRWILYSVKYLILFYFLYFILIQMPVMAVYQFMTTPYNMTSDVSMMLFFLNISTVAFFVLLTLIGLSLFIRNFWCRFLCPYGALIGLGSLFQLTKVKRNEESCIDCNACTRACPNKIDVAKKKAVRTVECTACLQCVEACPVNDTLNMTVATKKIDRWALPLGFFALFFIVVVIAKLTGHWESEITYDQYRYLIQLLEN